MNNNDRRDFFSPVNKKQLQNYCCLVIMFLTGVWRSLVARTAGGREVAGSNPVAPIEYMLCYCSQVIFREVFCHEYGKIPRHTGQNPITEGDLEWILTKLL